MKKSTKNLLPHKRSGAANWIFAVSKNKRMIYLEFKLKRLRE